MNFYHARSLSVLAMTAALVAAPLAASAAPGMPDEGGPRHHQKGGPDFGHHGPDFGRFGGAPGLHALNLSQDQQDQIFKIRHDQEQAFYDGKRPCAPRTRRCATSAAPTRSTRPRPDRRPTPWGRPSLGWPCCAPRPTAT